MRYIVFIALYLLVYKAESQTILSGKVLSGNKNPVPFASVTIRNSYDGATTDSAGNFSFQTSEKGQQVLEVTASGFNPSSENVVLDKPAITVSIDMKEMITELKAVVLTAGAFEAGDQKKGTVLNALDIVTTASAQGDVTGAIKTLPGAQQVGESEGLFVRGGTATESKIYIDGTLVNNFFYSSVPGIASRGRFNPFLFKGTVFTSGGYSALYGQALSSALILESRELPEKTQADLAISVIGAGGGIQKLSKDKKSSWGITYNYTNLWPAFRVIKQKQDFYEAPVYHNGDVNFRSKTKGGFIKYYGYFNWNKTGMRTEDIDSVLLKDQFQIRNINTYQNISWRERLGNGWKISLAGSFSTNRDKIQNDLLNAADEKIEITTPAGYAFKNFSLRTNSIYAQGRFVLEKKLKGLNAVRFGADHFISSEKSFYTLFTGDTYLNTVEDNLTALFAESDFYVSNALAAKAGIRSEYSEILSRWNIAPRISIAYKLSNSSQASFAYGRFYQNPETKYLPALSPSLDYAAASHYILQYQRLTNKKSFRVETFYKDYSNLFKTGSDGNGRAVATGNNGSGYAKGIEVFWRDKSSIKNLDYWISYSFLDTKRDFLNYPGSLQPSFATEHTASLVVKKFVLPWKTGFNASYNFASGRPYYNFLFDNTLQKTVIADQGRTIPYHNLAFSVNYLPRLGDPNSKKFVVWVLSISNVLGQKQVYTYNYATISNRKVEVTPPSRRFVYIGCFISFGIDRTEDAINNNL